MAPPKVRLRERLVLCQYGRTMLNVQLFEFTLRGLAVSLSPKLDKSADFDEVWKSVEPMFSGRVSAARLIGKITAPADLVAELVVAVSTRNTPGARVPPPLPTPSATRGTPTS